MLKNLRCFRVAEFAARTLKRIQVLCNSNISPSFGTSREQISKSSTEEMSIVISIL